MQHISKANTGGGGRFGQTPSSNTGGSPFLAATLQGSLTLKGCPPRQFDTDCRCRGWVVRALGL